MINSDCLCRISLFFLRCLGFTVTQLDEILLQARESLGHWDASLTLPILPHYGPVFDSASKENQYQGHLPGSKGDRCLGLTTLPHLHGECPEIVIC
jgi:hypothetical protein